MRHSTNGDDVASIVALMDQFFDPIAWLDPHDFHTRHYNAAFRRLGSGFDEPSWKDWLLPGDRERVFRWLARAAENDPITGDVRLKNSRIYRFRARHVRNGWLMTLEDVDQDRQTVAAYQAHQTQMMIARRALGLGYWWFNLPERLLLWSPETYRMFGLPVPDLITRVPDTLFWNSVHPEDRDKVQTAMEQALRDATYWEWEHRIILPDGQQRVVLEMAETIVEDGAVRLVGLVRDITARKTRDLEMAKVRHLEALGSLAGGIAHDFNNQLTVILGNLSLAEVHEDAAVQAALARAEAACLEARDLTRRLITFAKGGEPISQPASLGQLLSDIGKLVVIGSRIQLTVALADTLWPVKVDAGQIRQVVQNLLINAVQAMPEGGGITVSANNLRIRRDNPLPLAPGPYVALDVTDQGPGISEEMRAKIFDPYFTTKTTGHGLGLATCYSILRRHGGYITADSAPDHGATFRVYLPALPGWRLGPVVPPAFEAPLPAARVLLLEDDPGVREVVVAMLDRLGLEVVAAGDGSEALAALETAKASDAAFDVGILDGVVPGGSGGEAILPLVRATDPSLPLVISTGYVEGDAVARYREIGFDGVLAKPYRLIELRRVLEEILGGASHTSPPVLDTTNMHHPRSR